MQKHLIALKESKSEAFNQSINNIYQKSKNINFKPAMKVPNLPKNFFDSPDLSGFSKEDVMQFYTLYQEHFEASISAINNHQFEYLCAIWNAFWRHPSIDNSKYFLKYLLHLSLIQIQVILVRFFFFQNIH